MNLIKHFILIFTYLTSSYAGNKNIVQLAQSTSDLSTLVTALQAGNLVDTLSGRGPFTVFAPTNEAFNLLPKVTLDYLLAPENIKDLDRVLTYHVSSGSVFSSQLHNNQRVKTLEGCSVRVRLSDHKVYLNDARVITPDINATNGVVHLINHVLLPPDFHLNTPNIVELASSTPQLSTLVTALKSGNLVATLSGKGPFTVFAPTNDAFNLLPKSTLEYLLQPEHVEELDKILTYHVTTGSVYSNSLSNHQRVKTLEGGELEIYLLNKHVFVNSAKVITADVNASNGVVHLINRVLLPSH